MSQTIVIAASVGTILLCQFSIVCSGYDYLGLAIVRVTVVIMACVHVVKKKKHKPPVQNMDTYKITD